MPATKKNNTTTFPLLLCQTAVNRKEAFLLIFPFSKLAYALKEKAFLLLLFPVENEAEKTGTVILTDQTKMTTSRIGTGRVSYWTKTTTTNFEVSMRKFDEMMSAP